MTGSALVSVSVPEPLPEKVLVFGMATTGRAITDALVARGHTVLLADDAQRLDEPQHAGILIKTAPTQDELRELVASADAVAPSPGVPAHHFIYRSAQELSRPILGDLDLAARWDDRPLAAITGTNGKTTVTELSTAMLVRSGIDAVAAGNTEVPLVAAIDRHPNADMFVVEASSFRLATTQEFAPQVGAWLNLAPDHLDWHGDMSAYEEAKARIWRNATPVAIYPHPGTVEDVVESMVEDVVESMVESMVEGGVEDMVESKRASNAIAKHVAGDAQAITFAPADCLGSGDVAVIDDHLCAFGRVIIPVADMALKRPHDISNAAAATAIALEMGATDAAVTAELAEFEGLPHRLQLVGAVGHVTFYDDSKATTPQAVLAGLAGFENAVLIAGGRNKGLSLKPLQVLAPRLLAVVAIGESAQEISDIFEGDCRVEQATSMRNAVEQAAALATDLAADQTSTATETAVVLSPACASFDWYSSYRERGDDFASEVARLAGSRSAGNRASGASKGANGASKGANGASKGASGASNA